MGAKVSANFFESNFIKRSEKTYLRFHNLFIMHHLHVVRSLAWTIFVGLMTALFASAQQFFEGDASVIGSALNSAVWNWCKTSTRTSVESSYGSIIDWDVSRVTSMMKLFSGQQTCNPDISKWDVSSVTSMSQSESSYVLLFRSSGSDAHGG